MGSLALAGLPVSYPATALDSGRFLVGSGIGRPNTDEGSNVMNGRCNSHPILLAAAAALTAALALAATQPAAAQAGT